MPTNRSPPKHKKLTKGGSSSSALNSSTTSLTTLSSTSSTSTASSSSSARLCSTTTKPAPLKLCHNNLNCKTADSTLTQLYSCSSTSDLLERGDKRSSMQYHSSSNLAHHHHHHHHHRNSASSISTASTSSFKRGKKQNWGSRERAGMSFLLVIVFFAVFGLIILTEIFMIDERSHGGMMVLRHGGNYGTRLGDSMPDYDDVKDDYDLLDEHFLNENKLGYVQVRDNKLKIQDAADTADAAGRLTGTLLNSGANGFGGAGAAIAAGVGVGAGAGATGNGANVPQIPWGKLLPMKIEETLPRYPIGTPPTDGSWQVVNGTRFKFFVFSAYYDRRDGAKLLRVVGATKTRGPERVWCRFWYANRNMTGRFISATVMARVKVIRENWNLKYSACFILCPVRTPELDVPQYVSIVSRLRAPPGNLLKVRNTDWDPDFAKQHATTTSNSSNATSSSSSAKTSMPLFPTAEQIPDKIAVCVKPFHFNYDQALYLMEYLELYALLGVSHFTFYNHTIGPHASCVLEHYMSGNIPDKLTAWDTDVASMLEAEAAAKAAAAAASSQLANQTITANNSSRTITPPPSPAAPRYESTHYAKPTINILPWNLRMRSQKEIRTEGLFAALNDCLYRTMYRYKYLTLVDLDEFIVPRHNDTLNELISSLNQRFRNRNMGAYSFQNAFFYLQFPDDPLATSSAASKRAAMSEDSARLRASLVTQRKTRRRFKLHPQKQRSKYICKPEAVVEAGNHFVWEFSPGKGSLNVPPADAILQHYRVCEFGGNDCIKAPSIVDRTATKYVNRLLQRVETVYKHLKKRCDLPELPPLPTQTLNDIEITNDVRPKAKSNEPTKLIVRTPTNGSKPLLAAITLRQDNEKTRTPAKQQAKATRETAATLKPATMLTTTTTATTNNTTLTPTTTSTTAKSESAAAKMAVLMNARRKRKLIVFEDDENGVPNARIEYVE